jgi:tetratricopeptide (TPR) repeat protein
VGELGKAVEAFMAGRLDEARRACRKALQGRADLAEAHILLCEIHRLAGEHEREREAATRVLKLRPQWTEANVHLALGDLYSDFRRPADAEEAYRRALGIQPALSDARYNLAALLRVQERIAECIDELYALLQHEPKARDAREQLVRLLQDARRWEDVEALCRVAMDEPFFAEKLGVALWWKGRHDEAIDAYRRAGASPEARFLEANALLSLGRFAEGWPLFRFRSSRLSARARHPEIVEEPKVLQGAGRRIRVYAEQGLGDEIFFLRFAAALRTKGHRLDLVCEPKLARFLAGQPPFFEEINAPHPAPADLSIASGDLPLVAAMQTAPPLPLVADPRKRAAMQETLRAFGPPPYIGVTWRAGGDSWTKQVPPDLLAQALEPIDARIVVMQRKPRPEESKRFRDALPREALDLSASSEELDDALALLSVLDEYVAVSNTNLHLLAGLEKRTARVLVLTPPEWRWGLSAGESVWFPGFSLYRQQVGAAWGEAISALRNDFRQRNAATQHG